MERSHAFVYAAVNALESVDRLENKTGSGACADAVHTHCAFELVVLCQKHHQVLPGFEVIINDLGVTIAPIAVFAAIFTFTVDSN